MSQYLVEVTPGRELVYQTPLALRAAIRSGRINADSRIFHRATARWISITKHPEYRKVQAELASRAGIGATQPLELLTPPPTPRKRGFIPSLAESVLARAISRWISIWKHRDSRSTKPVKPPKPVAPPKPAGPSTSAGSPKPASAGQTTQPAQEVEPGSPMLADRHWTWLP